MKDRTRERSLPGLALGPGAQEPLGLSFRERQPARGLPGPGQGGRSELRVRPRVPGPADHRRPEGRGLRAGPERHRQRGPHVPSRAGLAGGHGGARHAEQAPRLRAAGGEDVFPVQRRPEGDDRPPADRARRAAGGARCPGPTRSPSTTRRTRWRRPSASSTSWTSSARRSWSRSRSSRSTAASSRNTGSRSRRRRAGTASWAPSSPRRRSRRRCGTSPATRSTTGTRPITLDDNPYDPSNLLVTAAARRHLPAAAERHAPRASWPTRSSAPWRARPRRPASATRCPSP